MLKKSNSKRIRKIDVELNMILERDSAGKRVYTNQTVFVYCVIKRVIRDVNYCLLLNEDIAEIVGSKNPTSIGNCLTKLYEKNKVYSINVCKELKEIGRILFTNKSDYLRWIEKYNHYNTDNYKHDQRFVFNIANQQRSGSNNGAAITKDYFNIDGMEEIWDEMQLNHPY